MKTNTGYTQSQQREIAIGAAWHLLGEAAFTATSQDALDILDEGILKDPTLVYAIWTANASEPQIKAFRREWNRLQKQKVSDREQEAWMKKKFGV